MDSSAITLVADGLAFGEGPRWHDNHLWFSDMHAHSVHRVAPDGSNTVVLTLDEPPSGLGFLPNGDLLVVAMHSRRVLRWDGQTLHPHADLSALATWHCNDMVVLPDGTAWVGNFGFDLAAGAEPVPACLARVDQDGSVHVAAQDLLFPNGTVVTPDGGTLVVAETFAGCLTAFDLGADKTLSNRRVWAQLPEGAVPDGICLDSAGAIWVASPTSNEVLRLAEGGEVLDRVALDRGAYACMLDQAGQPQLWILSAGTSDPERAATERSGQLLRVPAPAPGAGWP